jgi:methyl-accepting chemotaxis protein
MKHLLVWQKLALLGFVFLLPFAAVTYSYVEKVNDIGLDFAWKETKGTEYLATLRDYLRDLQRHRTLSQEVFKTSITLSPEEKKTLDEQVDAAKKSLRQTRDAVNTLNGSDESGLGALLRTDNAPALPGDNAKVTWESIRKDTDRILTASLGRSGQEYLAEHDRLIRKTLVLFRHVGDTSNLTLDPDLDSYYLMNVVVFQAPELKELMSQARTISAAAAARGQWNSAQRTEVSRLLTLIGYLRDNLRNSLDKAEASATNSDVKGKIQGLRGHLQMAASPLLLQTRALLNQPPTTPLSGTYSYLQKSDNAINACNKLQEDTVPELNRLLHARIKRYEDSKRLTLIVAGFGWWAVSVIALWLMRDITQPLRRTVTMANRIAEGDLSAHIENEGRRDELGTLAQTFTRMASSLRDKAAIADQIARGDLKSGNLIARAAPLSEHDVLGRSFSAMVTNLQQMLADVREATGILGSAAAEIVASTSQLTASSEETATAVTETTATVEEVRQTAQLSSQKARQVSDGSQLAAQAATNGRSATEATSAGMERIRVQMDSIAASMVRLSEQSQAISAIISSVDDLTQQSNLLAVNAAIEAAKAGEHGKGFAVVAHEVKSLAEQSRQATLQVRTILSDIQKATGAAVMATEQGAKAVEAGVQQAEVAGEAIEKLAGSIELAAQSAMQIAASSQEQLIGMDQVAIAMESVRQASHHNVESAQQLQSSARGLKELGQRLRDLVEKYEA